MPSLKRQTTCDRMPTPLFLNASFDAPFPFIRPMERSRFAHRVADINSFQTNLELQYENLSFRFNHLRRSNCFSSANAADTTVEMLNKRDDGAKMVYSEDIARIDVGDTITWVPTSKGHNVEFIAGPDGFAIPKKSKTAKRFQLLSMILVSTITGVRHIRAWA